MNAGGTPVRLMVVDDAPDTREVLQRILVSRGFKVFAAESVPEAVRLLESTPVDLVITDLKMPGASGLDLIRHVRENYRDTEVMMITGYPSIEGAVQALKSGAEDYLSKPFTQQELLAAVGTVLEKLSLRTTNRSLEEQAGPSFGLVGESEPMQGVVEAVGKAAPATATILITGESGTGKEFVARAIHYHGPRGSSPFVPVNCSGIPGGLQESELFGHVKGAFTGATETRAGFFQAAEGGTIFLDEVGDITAPMQAKLLRVLQDKEVCMAGSTKPRALDVRILAATNKDLARLVEKGVFREDLFYSLNGITIHVPPLRDRDNDVLLLARYMIEKFSPEFGRPAPVVSDRALEVLKAYPWPGNVRELENTMQRLVVMTDADHIDAPDLPAFMRFSALRNAGLNRSLADVELEHVRNVLASVDGNKTQAARILRIDRKTLRQKLLPSTKRDG